MSEDQKTYTFDCSCSNCGNRFSEERDYGQPRPLKTICPRCGNLAKTSVIFKPNKIKGIYDQ